MIITPSGRANFEFQIKIEVSLVKDCESFPGCTAWCETKTIHRETILIMPSREKKPSLRGIENLENPDLTVVTAQ